MKSRVLNFFPLELTGIFLSSFAFIAALLYTAGSNCTEGGQFTCGQNFEVPNSTSVPLSASYHNTFAIKADGTLWGWGSNDAGQIGNGVSTHRNNVNMPTQIGSENDWAIISTGWYHVLAIKNNGTLWSWGSNDYGQLGNGNSGYQSGIKSIPKQIGTDRDWIVVSAGNYHSVALKRDQSLWTWGWNTAGQLGNDNLNNVTKPTRMGTDSDWIKIAAGQDYTIALKHDGSIWSWGANRNDALGYKTDRVFPNSTPRQIGTAKGWTEINAGGYNAAIQQNGLLFVWGAAVNGLTGDGTKMIPISGSNWQSVSVGNNHGFAFSSKGGWCGWGQDILFYVESNSNNYVKPTEPMQLTGVWTDLIAGYEYSYGVRSDGSLWAWGINSLGELGAGNFSDIKVPTQVWKIK